MFIPGSAWTSQTTSKKGGCCVRLLPLRRSGPGGRHHRAKLPLANTSKARWALCCAAGGPIEERHCRPLEERSTGVRILSSSSSRKLIEHTAAYVCYVIVIPDCLILSVVDQVSVKELASGQGFTAGQKTILGGKLYVCKKAMRIMCHTNLSDTASQCYG